MAFAAPATTSPARSLAPREHGAYGQLGMPLVCGLLLGRLSLAGLALAAAAVGAFLAHEPLLILLGQRGRKARAEDGGRAARRLFMAGGAGFVLGIIGLILAPAAARIGAIAPAVLLGVVVFFIWRKEEKTTMGEVIAAAALSSAGMPVALACGASWAQAGAAWLSWSLSFLIATLAVRAVIARAKRQGNALFFLAVVTTMAALGATAGLFAYGVLPLAVPLSIAPFACLSLSVCLANVHPRHLRRVGWGLIGASVATLGILVVTLR